MKNLTLRKSFVNFEDGVKELKLAYPDLKRQLGDSNYQEDVIANLASAIVNNPPTVYSADYPSTIAINVSATMVSFKTQKFISFGWKVIFNEDKSVIGYEFRVTVFTRNDLVKQGKPVKMLVENNWVLSERDVSRNKKVQEEEE